jgi:hypothetical protein
LNLKHFIIELIIKFYGIIVYYLKNIILKKGYVIFIMICLLCNNLFAQTTFSKSLPQPQFFVIGLEQNNFPKLNGNWNDTVALKKYRNEIDVWLAKNILSKNQAVEFKKKYAHNQINTVFFKSLNDREKTKFKEVAKLLSYIIIGQKNKMMEEYFYQNSNKNKKDFYDEVEQIYFIHQNDLNAPMKKIKE